MNVNVPKFGNFVSWLTQRSDQNFSEFDIQTILEKIYAMVEAPPILQEQQLDTLLFLMAEGTRKIDAIKLHRQMTGLGLKESKDAIEKHWVDRTKDA